jgi:hypothetical protein
MSNDEIDELIVVTIIGGGKSKSIDKQLIYVLLNCKHQGLELERLLAYLKS